MSGDGVGGVGGGGGGNTEFSTFSYSLKASGFIVFFFLNNLYNILVEKLILLYINRMCCL